MGLLLAAVLGSKTVQFIDRRTKLFSAPFILLFGKRKGWIFPTITPILWSFLNTKKSGASFQNKWEMKKNFSPHHDGLLLDGHKHRLTERESFGHLVLMAPSRMGKTTRYVIPNIFTQAQQGSSLVISDLKGDIYRQTSGYLSRRGYKIKVINLQNPKQGSSSFNPLAHLEDYSDITEIAHVLVHSTNPQSYEKDPVWPRGAETLLKVIIGTLQGMKDPQLLHLPNVLRALQSMGNTERFEDWICRYADETTYQQYGQLTTGNKNMTRSYYSVAASTLDFLNDTVMAQLFTTHDLDFLSLRKEKTALYIIVPPMKLKEYGPIMNLLYSRLFKALMEELPSPQDKSIYLMGDEWGHTAIPNFETVATTIAQYRVSLSIVLQSLAQMEMNYGRNGAKAILEGGMSGKLFYGGLDIDTAEWASKMSGREVISERIGNRTSQHQQNLFNADRIRTLGRHDALLIHSNREPAILRNMAYSYEHPQFKRWIQIAPVPLPATQSTPFKRLQI